MEPSDFVVVDDRVGIVRSCKIVKRDKILICEGVEVWFGEIGAGGLPVTQYVPLAKCKNIKNARHVKK